MNPSAKSLVFTFAACWLVSSQAFAKRGGNPGGGGQDPPPSPPPALAYSIQFLSLGGTASTISDLNNLGQVVGNAKNPAGEYILYSYDSTTSTMSHLNELMVGTPWEVASSGSLLSINDVGQIGAIATTDWVGFEPVRITLDRGGGAPTVDVIGDPSATEIRIYDINNHGNMTGRYKNAAGETRGFVYSDAGGFVGLGTLGGNNSWGEAINDAGQVAGSSFSAPNEYLHAFRYTPGGGMEDLGNLATKSWAADFGGEGKDIAPDGTVIGETIDDKSIKGYYRRAAFQSKVGSSMEDLGNIEGGDHSHANSINTDGWVVGASEDMSDGGIAGFLPGPFRAALWSADFGMVRLQDFVVDMPSDFNGWLEEALVINNLGQIAGTARVDQPDGLGPAIAYLLTPVTASVATAVPEPGTAVLFLSAIYLYAAGRGTR